MQYIIMDLEWNTTYGQKINGFINEVIEIGAVKLDENLEVVDTFASFVKVQIGKKLMGRVKRLTNITLDDIRSGVPFTKAMSDFRHWVGSEDSITLTWGDTDIRVLIENYKYLNGISVIPFLENYANLQNYYQRVHNISLSKQVGLSAAAEALEINSLAYDTHRALGDSLLSAEIFRRSFDPEMLEKLTSPCDSFFYDKLTFKPFVVSSLSNPLVNEEILSCTCRKCHASASQLEEWFFKNQYFQAKFFCEGCQVTYKVKVRFKKYYDRLDINKYVQLVRPGEQEKGSETSAAN